MKCRCEELALTQMDKTSIAIANEVIAETSLKYENQSKSRILNLTTLTK
jgi:hypothetical protein